MGVVRDFSRAYAFGKLFPVGLLVLAPSFLAAQTSTVQTGTTPYAVAVNAVTGQVYIANQGSSTVTVINGSSTITVPVGNEPGAVAVNPKTNKIYVTNRDSGTVTVLDGLNPYSTKTLTVGAQPNAIAVDPTTDRVFVANGGGASVTVINGDDDSVLSTLPVGNQPAAITVNPSTNKAYVANSADNTVSVINGAGNTVLSTVSVGTLPVAIMGDPVTGRVYVVNQSSNNVAIIDGSTDTVVSTIAVGSSPCALAVDSVSGVTYVTNTGSNSVTAISSSGSTTQIPVGSAPNAIALNNFSNSIFVTNGSSNNVTIINGTSNSTQTTATGNQPKAVAVNPVNNHAYIANADSNTATIINGSGSTVATIQTNQQGPSQAILDPVNYKVWVTNAQAGSISIINPSTDSVTATLTGLTNPLGIALDLSTNQVYVVSQNGVTVYNASTNAVVATIPITPTISSGLIVVNSITHRIYVTNQYATQKSVTEINAETNTVEAQFDANGPQAIALNPVTNKIYIGEANGSNDVLVLKGAVDGTPASIATHVNVGAVNTGNPIGIAVNKKTNRIYVGGSNPTAAVIEGVTDTIVATVNLGGSNYATLLVNEETNQVIAANKGQNALSVINASGGDPETYTVNPTNLMVAGDSPLAAGVIDPTNNTIYFGQPYGSGVVIVDGSDFTNSYVVNTGQSPSSLVLDPATGKIYVTNSGANYVSVINGGSNFHLVPPATSVVGVADAQTVPDSSNPNYFQTTNPTPSFTATVASADGFPNATSVYYTVDGSTLMTQVPVTLSSGNTTTFNLTIGSQQVGPHTLFVYPAFGNEGGNRSSSLGTGNSPYLGTPATLPFAILQGAVLGTSLSVTATPNPQTLGGNVTITATLTPGGLNTGGYPTGNVTFTDELGNVLGNGTLPADDSGIVSITTTALTAGPHTITATYAGDTGYTGSTGSTGIVISLPATKVLAILGQPQSIVYGSAGFSNLVALVTDDNNVVVPGAQVNFTASAGSGLSFTPSSIATDTQGQVKTAVAQVPQAAGNYTATATLAANGATANFNLTVTRAPLSVLVDSETREYGQPNPTFTYAYAGFVNGDTASVISGAPVLSTTATQTSAPGDYGILADVSGLSAANYTFFGVNGTLTITAQSVPSITLSVSPATVVYGNASSLAAAIPAGATGSVSFYEGATLLGTATVDGTGAATLSSGVLNVGAHNITAFYGGDTNHGPAISDAKTLTVTAAPLNVTADSASRPYGQPNPVFTYSVTGFVNGDAVSVISGTPALATTATQNDAPGTYPIAVNVSGMSAANYTFVAVPGTLTISASTPPVLLGINPATVMYGNPSTLTGTVAAGATGTVSFYEGTTLLGTATINAAGDAVLPINGLNVGTHSITATYSGDANYTTANSAPQTLTVTQRTGAGDAPALTITVNDATRTATEDNPPFSYSMTGTLYNGDTYATALSGTPSYSTSAGSEPGSYAVTLTGLSSANYTITIVNGTLVVTTVPTTTTLTAGPSSPQYGDPVTLTANVVPPGATGTVSFYDGSVLLGSATVSSGTAQLVTSTLTAGTHSITAIYNGDGVYASSTSTPVPVTVAKKTAPGGGPALTVTVQDQSRAYGQANPTFSYTVAGTLVNGDTYATAVTGVPVYSTSAITSSPASPPTFPISVSGLSSANYDIAFVNGTLTIVPATSQTTLATSAATATYGTPITLTATVTPASATGTVTFSNGTTVLGTATLTGGTATLTTSLGVGSYTITSTYQGDADYGGSVSGPVSVTITPAPLTVTVQNATRPANQGNPEFSYTVSGDLYNGDTYATAVTGVPVYATTATPASVPGSYPVSITGGLNAGNYALTYVAGTLTVTQATSSVTLDISPATVVYGTASTLTATVTAGASGTVSFYDGTTLLGTATVNSSAIATLPISTLHVGPHSITAVYGGDTSYAAVTSTAQTLTVTPASLVVTAASATRAYGQPNPAFTDTVTGFVNGDTASVVNGSPVLATVATETSSPGTYAITVDVSGMFASDYTITAQPGTLTVTQATTSVGLSINPATVMYGNPSTLTGTAVAGATGTISFYEGTTLLGTATVDASGNAVLPISTLNVGSHSITATYNGDANYGAGTSPMQTLTVTQRTGTGDTPALTITVNDSTRIATETNPPFSYSATGQLYNGDTYATAISGTPSYSTSAGSEPGSYAVTLTGLSSANYTITIVNGTLTVTAVPTTTTLTVVPSSPQYGDPVTLTANVAPPGATGTISFYDGSVLLGSATVTGGTAQLVTSTLTAGTHSITAIYNGDGVYASSTSMPVSVTVAKKTAPGGGPALTVTVQDQSRAYGQANATFSYTVSGTLVGSDTYATAVTGVPVYSTSATTTSPTSPPTFPISVSGLSSANYDVAFVNGTLTIVPASSQTTLTASAATTQYGSPLTLTATVTPTGATGTVTFSNGTTVLGTATLAGGAATLTTASLSVGSYTITSTYQGDADYGGSISAPVSLTITPAPLTVTVQNATRPANQGNPEFSYTVSGDLYNGDTYATAVTGVPVYTTTATPTSVPGSYPASIKGGLASTNYALTLVPGTLTITQASSLIALNISPASMMYGNASMLTATVTTGATGTVSFYDGTTPLGTATVNDSGIATLSSGVLNAAVHTITATYSGDVNYESVTSAPQTLTVTPAPLVVTATSVTRAYGQPNPAFTDTVAGFVNGDTSSVLSGVPVLSTTATQTSLPGQYAITVDVSGISAENYTITTQPGILTVTQATPSVGLTISPATVMYGNPATLTGTVAAGATGTISFYEGITLLGTATVDASGNAVLPISTLNAGSHNITATYNGDANYQAGTSPAQTLTVTQRTAPGGGAALTITVNDATRIATETNPPFSYSATGQLYNGDTYATALSGTPSYSTSAGSNPGSFAVTLTGLNSANYTITFVSGTLIVTTVPTTTTLASGPASPQYGDPVTLTANVSPVGATGTVSFYDGSVLLGSANVSGGTAQLITSTLTAGTHSITAIYNGDGVYASSTSTPVPVTVAKKTAPGGGPALTVTVQNQSRAYGEANPTFSYTITGTLVNGDTYATAVTGVPVYSTSATTTSPTSPPTFPISVSGLSSANYDVAIVNGMLTIVMAPSQTALTTSAATAQYGSPLTLTATVTPTGATGTVTFSNGPTVLGTATISSGAATFTTTSLGVGSYTITSTYQGDANYGASISGPVSVTITPAPLTVTVQNASRPYHQGNPQFSYTVSGDLYNGDTYATAVTGVPVYKTDATVDSMPGNYAVSLTGGLIAKNYALTYVAGTLNITQATSPVTLSISPASVTYGTASTLTATATAGATGTVSFYEGAALLGTEPVNSSGIATLSISTLHVGIHNITAAYSGDTNYAAGTSTAQTLTVTPAQLTVTAASATRLYGQPNPAFTDTITGFVNGDTTAVVSGTPVLSTTATQTSAPDTYAIQIDVSGLSAADYTFLGVPGTLTITSATPTVGLTINPTSVMYGNPSTLTATVTTGATGTVSFYEGTTLLGTATVDASGNAVLPISTLSVGSHNITATYNGDANFEKTSSPPQTLTIAPRMGPDNSPALVIHVNDVSRTTIETNPPFTYSVTGDLVNGDTYATAITGTPTYATTAGSAPGTYSVTLTGLSSANYTVTILPGTLTIVLAPTATTLTATPASTQYGNPVTLTASIAPAGASGSVSFYDGSILLGSTTLSGGSATLTTTMLSAGAHSLTAVYNGDSVYASSQSDVAAVTIAKKIGPGGSAALTVTVENANRVFGTADPTFSYVVSGTLVNGDTYEGAVTGVPVYSVADRPDSPAGSTFPISVSGLASANYTLTFVPGTLTIASASSQTSLATSATTVPYGNPVTLTATVTPSTATGTVTFTDGTNVLGTATVSGGTATLTTELAVGAYTITATYLGDVDHGSSTSTPVMITVGKGALTVTVQNASRELGKGNPAFSYTVSGRLASGDTYATAVTGVPVYSTTATVDSPVGTYPISLLGGLTSTNYALAFVNGTLSITPLTSDFSITSSTPPQIIPPGASATYNIVLGSLLSPYNNPVGLTVTGLPQGATYTITPDTVTPGAAGANSTLIVSVPQQHAAVRTTYKPLFLATLLLLPCAAFWRRRCRMPLLAALIALIALSSLTGCGVGGYFSQPQQTYTLTVTGTSGILVHSTTVTLTVE